MMRHDDRSSSSSLASSLFVRFLCLQLLRPSLCREIVQVNLATGTSKETIGVKL